eukprot:GGOE01018555.1.p1 GENE.GGOE01018555.1~~GGOE01018555.1.p1  ORF type:complete len:475 (-),score=148.87 GGOE01018555.1:158-1516(-)
MARNARRVAATPWEAADTDSQLSAGSSFSRSTGCPSTPGGTLPDVPPDQLLYEDLESNETFLLAQHLSSTDIRIVSEACRRLCHLLLVGSLHRPVLSDFLFLLLRAFDGRHPELRQLCRVLLQDLCHDDEVVLRISEVSTGLEVLVQLLEAPPDRDVADNVLHAILFVCCREATGQLQRCEDRSDLTAALLELVREELEQRPLPGGGSLLPTTTPGGVDMLRVLVVTLYRLSLLENYRRRLAESGAVEVCSLLLRTDAPANRIVALQALYHIMVDNSVEFVVLNGVQPLAAMLCSKVPEECSMALDMALRLFDLRGDLVSIADQLVTFGALTVLAPLLAQSHPTVRQNALHLLCCIVRHGPEDYLFPLSLEPGVVDGALAVLKYDEGEAQALAAAFLWLLCQRGTGDVPDQIIQQGGVPLLQRLRDSCDATVRHNVIGCLKCLECFDGLEDT